MGASTDQPRCFESSNRWVEHLLSASAVGLSVWEKQQVRLIRGSSHVRYDMRGEPLRLLTNMPLTYLCEKSLVALTSKMYFALTWGLEEDITKVTKTKLGLPLLLAA